MANKTIDELTAGTTLDGTELVHGVQGGNSRRFTAADFQPGKGVAIASATTITLGYGNFFHVTGTTGITDIDFSAARDGLGAWIEFDDVLTITHNATTLDLPGGANITTAAGDRAYVIQDSSDNVHVLVYQRAGAPPPVITPWVSYTPTFTGLGTVSAISVFSRRIGDTLEVRGSFTTGSGTATEARMSLGFNGTNGSILSDAIKVPSTQLVGAGVIGVAAGSMYTVLAESNVGYLTFGRQDSTTSGLTKQNGGAWLNTSVFSFTANVPISGW